MLLMFIKFIFSKDKDQTLSDEIDKLSDENLLDISIFNIDSIIKKHT